MQPWDSWINRATSMGGKSAVAGDGLSSGQRSYLAAQREADEKNIAMQQALKAQSDWRKKEYLKRGLFTVIPRG